ncbi:hypothetical protein [uncultured Hymenobacter sp.]|uniref:hypothetical protein n=1 Tax=uncultured Hymenobacter sp. TaxID=170016 RepID=UPI0035CC47C5
MNDAQITPETNGIRYGLLTALAMAVYFSVAIVAGWADRIEFSFLNFAIMAVGVCLAIANFKRAKRDRMPYLQGFATGVMTAAISSLAFGLAFVLCTLIWPNIMDQIHARDLFGFDLSITIAFLAILLQGAMVGAIITLVAMQYFKSPDHKPIEGIE